MITWLFNVYVTKKFIRNDILEIIEILNCIENG